MHRFFIMDKTNVIIFYKNIFHSNPQGRHIPTPIVNFQKTDVSFTMVIYDDYFFNIVDIISIFASVLVVIKRSVLSGKFTIKER